MLNFLLSLEATKSLNPYSTGSWVAGKIRRTNRTNCKCLNPYSTGSWVAGRIKCFLVKFLQVLILILLEVGLLGAWKTTSTSTLHRS